MDETKTTKKIGRQPDFNLSAMDKATDAKGKVGVAWKNDDGSISVKLDSFVVLYGHNENLVLTLFVNDKPFTPKKPTKEIPY